MVFGYQIWLIFKQMYFTHKCVNPNTYYHPGSEGTSEWLHTHQISKIGTLTSDAVYYWTQDTPFFNVFLTPLKEIQSVDFDPCWQGKIFFRVTSCITSHKNCSKNVRYKVLAWSEIHVASFRIWTQVTDSISCNNNTNCIFIKWV